MSLDNSNNSITINANPIQKKKLGHPPIQRPVSEATLRKRKQLQRKALLAKSAHLTKGEQEVLLEKAGLLPKRRGPSPLKGPVKPATLRKRAQYERQRQEKRDQQTTAIMKIFGFGQTEEEKEEQRRREAEEEEQHLEILQAQFFITESQRRLAIEKQREEIVQTQILVEQNRANEEKNAKDGTDFFLNSAKKRAAAAAGNSQADLSAPSILFSPQKSARNPPPVYPGKGDDDGEDKKPAAKPSASARKPPPVYTVNEDDDDDEEEEYTQKKPAAKPSVSARKKKAPVTGAVFIRSWKRMTQADFVAAFSEHVDDICAMDTDDFVSVLRLAKSKRVFNKNQKKAGLDVLTKISICIQDKDLAEVNYEELTLNELAETLQALVDGDFESC